MGGGSGSGRGGKGKGEHGKRESGKEGRRKEREDWTAHVSEKGGKPGGARQRVGCERANGALSLSSAASSRASFPDTLDKASMRNVASRSSWAYPLLDKPPSSDGHPSTASERARRSASESAPTTPREKTPARMCTVA